MKRAAVFFAVLLSGLSVSYLLGAFACWRLNPADWDILFRSMVALWGGCASVGAGLYAASEEPA